MTLALTAALLAVSAAPAAADDWEVHWAPYYMWMAQLDGTVTTRGLPVDVNYSFSQILDNLDFVFTSNVRASKGKWGLVADINYIDLGVRKGVELLPDLPTGPLAVDIDFKMLTFDGLGSYQLADGLDAVFGARFYNLDNTTVLAKGSPLEMTVSGSKTWADAVGGLRLSAPLSDRLTLGFRGDVGAGGSNFAWHVLTGLGVELSDRFGLFGGYKALDIDYEDGEGNELFGMDTNMRGFIVGLDIAF